MSDPQRPTIGALGLGWIGRKRLRAIDELADIAVLADPDPDARRRAAEIAPSADRCAGIEGLVERPLDGVMVATPSALHARQTERLLESGKAVFCQKPLGRTAPETRRVVATARRVDRLLGVDFSYRHVDGVPQMRQLIVDGQLGEVFSADLVFHNAYGPDKSWFYCREDSGGGCVIDLGIHLVDMALWMLGFPEVRRVTSRCYADGELLESFDGEIEDYAEVVLDLAVGAVARIACSWHLHAGRDCTIGARFAGTHGGVELRNVDGSFYEFVVERMRSTETERLASPPDAWGGRAAAAWLEGLEAGGGFDEQVESAVTVAEILDRIYGRAPVGEAARGSDREAVPVNRELSRL